MYRDKDAAIAALEAERKAAEQTGHPVINRFDGEYRFLSNFYEAPVTYHGVTYRNNEAAFQAQKCPDKAHEFADMSAAEAKKAGRHVPLRPDWERVKINIMHDLVFEKFLHNPELKDKLLATDGYDIVEGNHWGDRFWGRCNGTGENHLGQILMLVREELA